MFYRSKGLIKSKAPGLNVSSSRKWKTGEGKEGKQTNEKKVNEGWDGSVFLSVSLPPQGIILINGNGDPLGDSVC